MIDYIEPNTFCVLNLYNSLTLSGNNLSATNLYCLEKVSYLYLANVQLKGEIDQKRIGNPQSVQRLDFERNKISRINFDNMTRLDILYVGSNELNKFSEKITNCE
ncbi:hypothetical protein BpHYR1_029353 [Brachionus plicatilis]|uniref:Uncharacterized protein n=1 Tax=Brachionus plicatilis TaxID=10195 RepID=A0A3M7SRM3_BRAPC|nr:hypothetical protein BpHYR1_029353 [Brachionus plicatilis]